VPFGNADFRILFEESRHKN